MVGFDRFFVLLISCFVCDIIFLMERMCVFVKRRFLILLCFISFILLFVLCSIAFAENGTHPDDLVGTAFGTNCYWAIDEDNCLWIWAGEGGGTLPSNDRTSSMYYFWPWYTYRSSITRVVIETGVVGPSGSLACMFYQCSKVVELDVSNLNTCDVVDMQYMFYYCSKLTSLNVLSFNTGRVTNMESMFHGCSSLTSLDVSSFNTSNVVNMRAVFSNCRSLISLDLSNFDTSNVTTMRGLFSQSGCLSDLNLSGWNTSNVINMCYMFNECSSFVSLDVSDFDTSNVTDMNNMFCECSKLQHLDLSSFDTSKVEDMNRMFSSCFALLSLNVSSFDTRSVENMRSMFAYCSKLEELDLFNFNTRNVTNMQDMFNRDYKLSRIRVGVDFSFNGSSIVDVNSMALFPVSTSTFYYTGNWVREDWIYGPYTPEYLRDNYDGSTMFGWWLMEANEVAYAVLTEDNELIFFRSTNVYGNNVVGTFLDVDGNVYEGRVFSEIELVHANNSSDNCKWTSYRRDIVSSFVADGQVIAPISTAYWFYECSNMTFCDVSGFDMSNVVDTTGMFSDCSKLTELDVSGFNTMSLTSMLAMFRNCSQLTELDVSHFITSNVTNMNDVFNGCSKLRNLDLSGFDTSSVIYMSSMFRYCSSLTELNLSNFDTGNVTTMSYMFSQCSSLLRVDVSSFDTSNVSNMDSMFGCRSLCEVNLGLSFSFDGIGGIRWKAILPVPSGSDYTGKWIREDRAYGPYTSAELRDNYDGFDMSGLWIAEESFFMLSLVPPEDETDSYGGSMENHKYDPTVVNQVPWNSYYRFGYKFNHWTDGTYEYENGDTIPANRYAYGDRVTLTAVFDEIDTSVGLVEGMFDLYLQGGGYALLNDIPGNVQYQVYEEIPSGWQLVKQGNTDGSILNGNAYVVFENRYDPDKVVVQFIGQKKVVNDDGDVSYPSEGMYDFVLTDVTDNVVIQTVGNSDGGLIVFDPIEFVSACEKVYEIREISGSDSEITYDDHVERITVTVSDFGDELTSNVDIDDDGILFTNRIHISRVQTGALSLSKQALSSSGSVYWFPGQVFRFEIRFYNERHAVPDDVCASYLSEVASANGWYYDSSTGVLHLSLTQQTPSVMIDNIPVSLYYEVSEIIN